jgi:hypothetical protein
MRLSNAGKNKRAKEQANKGARQQGSKEANGAKIKTRFQRTRHWYTLSLNDGHRRGVQLNAPAMNSLYTVKNSV